MLSHLSFSISNLDRAAAFYDAVLGALGYRRVFTGPNSIGYGGEDGNEKFAIKQRVDRVTVPSAGFHLAFAARSREDVDAFHAAALAHGGSDNGAPGLRPHFGPDYYAAFLLDPDGYELEAKASTADQGS